MVLESTLQPIVRASQFLWPRAAKPRPRDWQTVRGVRDLAANLGHVSDQELAGRVQELRRAAVKGGIHSSQRVLSGFALVVEAARRALGITLYDEQILAGLILTQRTVAEMRTGEGKTYVVSLPACIHSLAGQGVHVVTANEYLAQRDYELLRPVFQLLGISVGLLRGQASPDEKRAAYACDVTYGTDQDFGFDYLRDQLSLLDQRKLTAGERFQAALRGQELAPVRTVQRSLAVAIIDEVDSVLLDSSTSPLLLSLGSEDMEHAEAAFRKARHIAEQLLPDADYVVEAASGRLNLTEAGSHKVFSSPDAVPQRGLCRPWALYVEQALRAKELLHKDVHYIVQGGKVLLVDETTGRIFPERHLRDGLHQAVEIKEGLAISAETRPVARISKQRYFYQYRHLCGMTGTARESTREFWDIFRLRVVVVPPRKACRRTTLPARFYGSAAAKYAAIVQEVEKLHRSGQPVLVGTRTIETSEVLARELETRGIPHRLLNGKQDLAEAVIIAQAGEMGAVTIATNMAGRGTDIRLGPGAAEAGGLYVIVVEKLDSVRIDRQLEGRAGRQADPGACRSFVSADDLLLQKFAPGLGRLLQRLAGEAGEVPIDFSAEIARLQRRIERIQFRVRRRLLANDRWLEDVLVKWTDSGERRDEPA